MLNVSAHTGSLLAVLLFFKKEIIDFGKNQKLFFRIIFASIPLFLFGYLIVKYNLVSDLRTYKVIGWTTIILTQTFSKKGDANKCDPFQL